MSDAPIAINIDFDCKDVTKALEKLKAHLKSRTLIDELGQTVQKWSRDRIKSRLNTAPDGRPWESLAASTIKYKARKGYDQGTLIMRSPNPPGLYPGIEYDVKSDHEVSIGADMVYAMIHQRGGKAGRGLKANIPARPYLGVSDKEKNG